MWSLLSQHSAGTCLTCGWGVTSWALKMWTHESISQQGGLLIWYVIIIIIIIINNSYGAGTYNFLHINGRLVCITCSVWQMYGVLYIRKLSYLLVCLTAFWYCSVRFMAVKQRCFMHFFLHNLIKRVWNIWKNIICVDFTENMFPGDTCYIWTWRRMFDQTWDYHTRNGH